MVATILVERILLWNILATGPLDLKHHQATDVHKKTALSARKPKPVVDARRESGFDGRRLQSIWKSRIWPTRLRVSPLGRSVAPGYLQK